MNLLLNLSYQNLLKATDGFSSTNLIGMGNFGSVYKGILDQGRGRHTIAVKVLNLLHHGASKSFMAECEALQNIRHRNIVKVLHHVLVLTIKVMILKHWYMSSWQMAT